MVGVLGPPVELEPDTMLGPGEVEPGKEPAASADLELGFRPGQPLGPEVVGGPHLTYRLETWVDKTENHPGSEGMRSRLDRGVRVLELGQSAQPCPQHA